MLMVTVIIHLEPTVTSALLTTVSQSMTDWDVLTPTATVGQTPAGAGLRLLELTRFPMILRNGLTLTATE